MFRKCRSNSQTGPSCLQLPLYRSRIRPPDLLCYCHSTRRSTWSCSLCDGSQQGGIITIIRNKHMVLGRYHVSPSLLFWTYVNVLQLKKIGLIVNPFKCEVISMSYPVDKFKELVTTLASDFPGLKSTELADMDLLGSAILDQAVKKAIANKLHTDHLMAHRPQLLQQTRTRVYFFSIMHSHSLVFFSYSGRPLDTVILTTLHPMTNAP